ncbi:MAG: hypothetical protein KAT71_07550 [Gammaproteobacteria bacterium]|nr:hypothetical protein [Gammaproteobacteria bacterium]
MVRVLFWILIVCLLAVIAIGGIRYFEIYLLTGQNQVNNPVLTAAATDEHHLTNSIT